MIWELLISEARVALTIKRRLRHAECMTLRGPNARNMGPMKIAMVISNRQKLVANANQKRRKTDELSVATLGSIKPIPKSFANSF